MKVPCVLTVPERTRLRGWEALPCYDHGFVRRNDHVPIVGTGIGHSSPGRAVMKVGNEVIGGSILSNAFQT